MWGSAIKDKITKLIKRLLCVMFVALLHETPLCKSVLQTARDAVEEHGEQSHEGVPQEASCEVHK